MLLILTSSYSGLLSLAAHCSKKLKKKKKNCLIKHVCPFSTFPLTGSTFFAFSRLFASCFPSNFFFFLGSLFSHAYAFASFLFFILFYFLFSSFSLNPSRCFPFLNPRRQTHLLFNTPSDQTHHHKHASSLLPLTECTITNLSILSLIEPTITNPTAYLLPLTEPFFSP